jgi:hypothetical protein
LLAGRHFQLHKENSLLSILVSLFFLFYRYKYPIPFHFSFPAAAYFLGGKSITFGGLKLEISLRFFFLKKYLAEKGLLLLRLGS